jgi:hypothetical protein
VAGRGAHRNLRRASLDWISTTTTRNVPLTTCW